MTHLTNGLNNMIDFPCEELELLSIVSSNFGRREDIESITKFSYDN